MKRLIFAMIAAATIATAAAQPKVIAHRGFWDAPGSAQNSIRALVKADSIGCWGSEFDVWMTADDKLVVNHDASFKGLHILFDKEEVCDTLGETVSKAGKRQLRIAETEKYAHVTFFFNGGRETPFELEDRILVNSPKVATYDLQPEMSAVEVTSKLCEAIRSEKEDMIILNFANGDMVGHTGVYNAICNAVGCIDGCVETVVTCALAHDYVVLLTADHGNADYAVNPDGSPNTAHSLNEVQFIVIGAGDEVKEVKDGALCNVAPTILKLMGIPQPAAMTAEPLI